VALVVVALGLLQQVNLTQVAVAAGILQQEQVAQEL
jgi:hypothetical protein